MIDGFPKYDRVSARIHPSEKQKLKKSGHNAREAIEYFNSIYHDKVGALKIEEYFLNKEIEDIREQLILKERKLSRIQQAIDEFHIDKLSSFRVDSYQKIIDMYNRHNKNSTKTHNTFEEFIQGKYIREEIIEEEVLNFPDCSLDEYCCDLLQYYNDVVLVSRTV